MPIISIRVHHIFIHILQLLEKKGATDFIQSICILKFFGVIEDILDGETQTQEKFRAFQVFHILSDPCQDLSVIPVIDVVQDVQDIHLFCSVGAHIFRVIPQLSLLFA